MNQEINEGDKAVYIVEGGEDFIHGVSPVQLGLMPWRLATERR